MPLRWKINVSTVDQRDISSQVRANITSVRANAEEGSVAMSTIVVDDPDGTLDVPPLKEIYGQETEATNPTFYRGVIADRTISRGEADKSFRTTTARQWDVQMADQNERLSRRVLLGADANRPAETDVARIQYVMGSPEMTSVGITSSTYVDTTGPIAMDAADYRGQTVLSLINDCAQASGKNYWVMRRDDLGERVFGLWYDFAGSTVYEAAIAISNVETDVDGVATFGASRDTKLMRDPSRVYSGVYLPFSGGAVYQQQTSTSSNFHARDTTSYSANVKTTAKANARALRYLADIDTEEDRIETSILVPNAQVDQLREGQLVWVTFSHLPGYETATRCRVLNRTVTQESEEFYRLSLELSPATAGTPVPTCSYVEAPYLGFSSADVLGGRIRWDGKEYIENPSGVYPSTMTYDGGNWAPPSLPFPFSDAIVGVGTENTSTLWSSGNKFGVLTLAHSGDSTTVSVTWTWDLEALGRPSICRVGMMQGAVGIVFHRVTVKADGVTIISPGTWTNLTFESTGIEPNNARYWSVHFEHTFPTAYVSTEQLWYVKAFMLWAAV